MSQLLNNFKQNSINRIAIPQTSDPESTKQKENGIHTPL